jgi:hypothetical protein
MMKNKQGRGKGTVCQGNNTVKSFPHSSLRSDRAFPVPPLCRRIAHRPPAWPQDGEAGLARRSLGESALPNELFFMFIPPIMAHAGTDKKPTVGF